MTSLRLFFRALQQLLLQIVAIVGALKQQGAPKSLGHKDFAAAFKHVLRCDPKTTRHKPAQAHLDAVRGPPGASRNSPQWT